MNPRILDEIKTEYVKSKIAGLEFNEGNLEYIQNLIRYEGWTINGVTGQYANLAFLWWKSLNRDDYLAILDEVDAKRAKKEREKFKQQEQQRITREKDTREREKQEQEELRKKWAELGGNTPLHNPDN